MNFRTSSSNQTQSHMLQKLTVVELLHQTASAAKEEQAATLKLLEHLAEVERRKAYAGKTTPVLYTGLFDCLRRGLGYSDSQAAERVAATRLLLQAPTLKPAIESGQLSLTSAAQVQRFIERERRLGGVTHSAEVLAKSVVGKSKCEIEQTLFDCASPKTQAAMNERVRPVLKVKSAQGPSRVQVHAELDETLVQKAKELVYTESVSELLERALKLYVEHHSKRLGRPGAANAPSPCRQSSSSQRTISIHDKRTVWRRAESQCEFKNERGERCSSTQMLEIDHRLPLALGGLHKLKNLQLLCRTHNQKKGQWIED